MHIRHRLAKLSFLILVGIIKKKKIPTERHDYESEDESYAPKNDEKKNSGGKGLSWIIRVILQNTMSKLG